MSFDHTSGVVVSVNSSPSKGMRKRPVMRARAVKACGIEGDAHAGDTIRQISLLATESIGKMRTKGLDVGPGDFAENITTKEIDLLSLKLGDRLKIGSGVIIEITQIGKICHDRCAIYEQAGDCVMPREGVFAKVIGGGEIRNGDVIAIVKLQNSESRSQ